MIYDKKFDLSLIHDPSDKNPAHPLSPKSRMKHFLPYRGFDINQDKWESQQVL